MIFLTSFCNLRDSRSDSDESTDYAGASSEVGLKLSNLESYHAAGDEDKSQYAENGANPKRIRQLLANPPCDCQCTLPFGVLYRTCQTFWSLPKVSQDSILWSLQGGSGRKATWSIEGRVFLLK